MTVEQIIEAVRFCIDEEDSNPSSLANVTVLGSDNVLMDNIIKSKIGDALRWICLYAPADMLGGTDEPDTTEQGQTVHHPTGIITDVPSVTPTAIAYGSGSTNGGRIDMPSDFIRLVRVRTQDWHRAVAKPIAEDSEEYLQLYDENGATATMDRPVAAIIEGETRKLEVWPAKAGSTMLTFSYSYVAAIGDNSFDVTVTPSGGEQYTETHYPLPPKARTAFIYYLAFLLLCAYGDGRADRMLAIAKMNLGLIEK